jgi:hypothetical protein
MNQPNEPKIVANLPEFKDLSEELELASGESLKKVYLQKNDCSI